LIEAVLWFLYMLYINNLSKTAFHKLAYLTQHVFFGITSITMCYCNTVYHLH